MKIIGFNIRKLFTEKKGQIKQGMTLKNNLNIDDISEDNISISNKPALKFDFSYYIEYEPQIAEVRIEGSAITIDEKDESKEILKEWKSKKTFTHESKIGLFNFILGKCNLKALELEDDLGLPLHVPFPQLISQKQKKEEDDKKAKYTG